MKAGKSSNQALLRTLANKEALNFATRRLLKDLKEFENNKIPTVGVSARPMDDDLFVWHANIRGPEGTPYEGGVFHLELKIPQTYPHEPPVVELLVDLPHPNVFGRKVCLDMLENDRTPGKGWSSGYSIMSVLIQLQSFLFEKFYDDVKREAPIKKAIETANQFKCGRKNCKHGGKLAAWPPFDSRETAPEAFKIIESETELFEKELVCYHTKMNHEENALGIGLEISRIARTGMIKNASPCLDYISLKAFIKEGIRESSTNEKFSYWLPLLFGTQYDRTLHLGKKSISMICTGHTKRFREAMVLDLFPKILVTLGVQIMNEKRHASIRIFRILFHIHYLYLTFLSEYPHLREEIAKSIQEFNTHEEKRHKDTIPSLGAYLTHFIVNWNDMDGALDAILEEQLDRQVLWLLKQVPELEDESGDSYLDDKRAMICFKSQQSSYQLVLFWVMLSKFFKNKFKSTQELIEFYKTNLGRLNNESENEIQKRVFEILKIENYDAMFQYLNKGKLSEAELNKRLKQAVKNSKRRKYHGTDDELLALPPKEEQLRAVNAKLPKLLDFIDAEKKALKNVSEEEWQKACLARWSWAREICENYKDTKPNSLARQSDEYYSAIDVKKPEKLVVLKENYLQNKKWSQQDIKDEKYPEGLTWRDLFIKMDIEEHLWQMDNDPNFKDFYTKLQSTSKFVTSLVIPIVSVKNIKSGHYYLTALLSHLTSLKHLQIVGPVASSQLTLPALKALNKGFNNFIKDGGVLDEIIYNRFNITQSNINEVSEQLYHPLRQLTDIKIVTIKGNNMLYFKGGKALSDIVTTHKNLRELNIINANLNDAQAKEIADGLMRAKQIEVLNLSYNTGLTHNGLNSIIYNLAFSPRLLKLDLSYIPITSNPPTLIESLYKLLRISGSLEILNLNNCGSIGSYLTEQFFIALGESRTLKKLNLSYSGVLNTSAFTWLGKAVAFNAQKKGSLEALNLAGGVINSSYSFNNFYNGMLVSNADHETWYGDSTKVSKMSGQDFAKTYCNNLKVIDLSNSILNTNFDIVSWRKQLAAEDPPLVKFIARSPLLTNIQLNQCNLNKQDADVLALALDSTRPYFVSKIKILNLSRNLLGKEGAKTFAGVLEKNHTLEAIDLSHNQFGVAGAKSIAISLSSNKSLKYLNLYANKIDVDGARAFEKTLQVNSSLEYIDFGYNRLRNEGLAALARGISANKGIKLRYLGLRFNFIDADGVTSFLKKVYNEGSKPSLEEIFIKNNTINEFGLNDILKVYQKLNVKLAIDSFDKFRVVENDILERTIWVHPAPGNEEDVRRFFETTHKCGVVLQVRKRTGVAWPNRKVQSNTFYFVEFASPVSVTRALYVAARKESSLCGVNVRIYKAGSGTYNYTKSKRKNQKKSQTNVFAGGRGGRRGGRGGRGGRGRGRGRR